MTDSTDRYWMTHALALAKRGQFSAAPNPHVGCVIVKNGEFIAGGWHERAGTAHAEIHALNMAGAAAEGSDVYVTLEPCAHFGRTPPCADALVAACPKRVIIACTDPNPLVAGKGIEKLRAAGITVTDGVCEKEALMLNRPFFHRMRTGRPLVTVKLAASMDGRTALANGESQWITEAAAREDVHLQRLAADAVIAGTGSVIADNARLTARYNTPLPANPPLRVIIDSRLQTPANAAVFDDPSPILIATVSNESRGYPAHAEILRLPANKAGKVPLDDLLDELGKRQINHVFAECGTALAGAFLDSALADEILLYLAPTFLGETSRPLLNMAPLDCISDKIRWHIADSRPVGADWRFTLQRKG